MPKVPAPAKKDKVSQAVAPAAPESAQTSHDARDAQAIDAQAIDAQAIDAQAERIAELMERTARAIFKARTAGGNEPRKLKPEALTLTLAQMRCLRVLSHEENCTMRDLSRHLGVGPSTACEMVDALVRADLVQRTPDPNDRRAVRLSLSAKGRRLKDKHRAEHREHLRAVIENLSDEQRHAMLGALETLVAVLRPEPKERCASKERCAPREPKEPRKKP